MSDHPPNANRTRRPTLGFVPHAPLSKKEVAALRISLRVGAPVHCPRCLSRVAVDGPRGRGSSPSQLRVDS